MYTIEKKIFSEIVYQVLREIGLFCRLILYKELFLFFSRTVLFIFSLLCTQSVILNYT